MNEDTQLGQRVARTEAGIVALTADVKSLAESVAALTKTVNDKFEARAGINWGAMSVLVILVGGAIGGAYTLQNKENERLYGEQAHLRDDSTHSLERIDRKFAHYDELAADSMRERTSLSQAMKEVETQFKLGRQLIEEENASVRREMDLKIELESSRRDLAIERHKALSDLGLQDATRKADQALKEITDVRVQREK